MSSYAVSGVSREVPSERSVSPLSLAGAGTGAAGGLAGPEPENEVDPELLALPDPPRRERTVTVLVLLAAALAALAMVLRLRGDLAYALTSGPPAHLGDLGAAAEVNLAAYENRFVRADAMLGAAGGIRYERPFVEDTFRTLPVAGRTNVWVDVRVPAGQETGRWEPPRAFMGRLVRFGGAGLRHRGLAGAIGEATHADVPSSNWLLIDGEAPDTQRWAIVLALAFFIFAAWNFAAIGRVVRKVR
jgi:hypothetical protein